MPATAHQQMPRQQVCRLSAYVWMGLRLESAWCGGSTRIAIERAADLVRIHCAADSPALDDAPSARLASAIHGDAHRTAVLN